MPLCAYAQCGGNNDGQLEPYGGAIWLHPECVRFWKVDDDLDLSHPAHFLHRGR